MVADPELWSKQIFEKIELPWENRVLDPGGTYKGIGPGQTERDRPIDTRSLALWKETLSETTEKEVWKAGRKLMEHLGYIRNIHPSS